MCQAVDEALLECKEKEKEDERRMTIIKLMKKSNIDQDDAMALLDIPLSKRINYKIVDNLYVIHFLNC